MINVSQYRLTIYEKKIIGKNFLKKIIRKNLASEILISAERKNIFYLLKFNFLFKIDNFF